MDVLIRSGIAIIIVVAGIGLYIAISKLRLVSLHRSNHQRVNLGLDPHTYRAGVPAILYFTTPTCAPCRTIQAPAIEELRAQFGARLQIVKVDASEKTELADQWGVLSVPTTFIIDAQGRPRHVNNGVTPATKLRLQLRAFVNLDEPRDPPSTRTPTQLVTTL